MSRHLQHGQGKISFQKTISSLHGNHLEQANADNGSKKVPCLFWHYSKRNLPGFHGLYPKIKTSRVFLASPEPAEFLDISQIG